MEPILTEIYNSIVDGDRETARTGVQRALDAGIPPAEILNHGLVSAMSQVGELFEAGEYYVPEMLIAAKAMQAGLALLRPHLVAQGVASVGRVVIGTVQGDLHDIGKNLVAMMLEGGGFEVIDLGSDVSPEKFVEAVRTHQPDLVGMSALLTTTMTKMKTTIEAIQSAGLREQVKVLIGGAPITAAFAAQIGADAFSPDASAAVHTARSLVAAHRA